MNHIATRAPSQFPAISPELGRLVEARTDTDADSRDRAARYGSPPTPALIAEAEAAVPGFFAALKPIDRDALVAWAEPINAAVRNPQGRQDFLIRVSTWAVSLADVPARCFTPEAQREALRTFQFWPSAADVYALLAPQSAMLKAAAQAVRDIANQPQQAPASHERPAPTEDERAGVAAQLAALKAELRTDPVAIASERPQARYLPREMLNRIYAAEGMAGPRTPPHPGGAGE